jgi:hypothetical protein
VVAVVSIAIFVALAPFAKVALAPVPGFIPAYQSALAINDLITAVLLFGQFDIVRSRALLALATGYVFTAFLAIVHMLSFPGLFSPTGLLGAGPQTTAWLYMFWHGVMVGNHYTTALIWVIGTVWAANVVALVVLWRRRPHSVLDLWMMVVLTAWLFDIALSGVLNAGRYDLGFYAGRIFGLLASSFVVLVLLVESGQLYVRLAHAHQT